jgi:predicted RNA-binding Zn ribbon-like protein
MNGFFSEAQATPIFHFLANQTALDLANTLAASKEGPRELLADFSTLIKWLSQANLLPKERTGLVAHWSRSGQNEFLNRVKAYRSIIKEWAGNIESRLSSSFAAETNRLLKEAGAVIQVEAQKDGRYRTSWVVDWNKPESLLGVVAEAGVQLLCECDHALVRKCEDRDCVLFFYDTTKNHQRRWCSMGACGNRHKAALHRQKVRSGATGIA